MEGSGVSPNLRSLKTGYKAQIVSPAPFLFHRKGILGSHIRSLMRNRIPKDKLLFIPQNPSPNSPPSRKPTSRPAELSLATWSPNSTQLHLATWSPNHTPLTFLVGQRVLSHWERLTVTTAHVYPCGLQVLLDLHLLQPGQGWAGLSPHNGLHQGFCMGYSGHGCQGGA